jgi:hypothetical protein
MEPLCLDIDYGLLQGLEDSSVALAIGGVLARFDHFQRIHIDTLTWQREPGYVDFGHCLAWEEAA